MFPRIGKCKIGDTIAVRTKGRIVIVMADDMGVGDLGRYNCGLSWTPNIERLMDEGLMLSQHYSGSTSVRPRPSGISNWPIFDTNGLY